VTAGANAATANSEQSRLVALAAGEPTEKCPSASRPRLFERRGLPAKVPGPPLLRALPLPLGTFNPFLAADQYY